MAQNFVTVEKAAEMLGITVEQVNLLRERRQLTGYRDGAVWKFKTDDVQRLAQSPPDLSEDDLEADVLLTDREFGGSGLSTVGTVIGGPMLNLPTNESDIKITTEPAGPTPSTATLLDFNLAADEPPNEEIDHDVLLTDAAGQSSAGTMIGGSLADAKPAGESDIQIAAAQPGEGQSTATLLDFNSVGSEEPPQEELSHNVLLTDLAGQSNAGTLIGGPLAGSTPAGDSDIQIAAVQPGAPGESVATLLDFNLAGAEQASHAVLVTDSASAPSEKRPTAPAPTASAEKPTISFTPAESSEKRPAAPAPTARQPEQKAPVQKAQPAPPVEEFDDEDVTGEMILQEREFGGSGLSAAGTVVSRSDQDILFGAAPGSEIDIVGGSTPGEAAPPAASASDEYTLGQFPLTDDSDLTLDDTTVNIPAEAKQAVAADLLGKKPAGKGAAPESPAPIKTSSSLELGNEDDEFVIAGSGSGSGTGSDVAIGGDSGISLVDPKDSGLSLEEPVEFQSHVGSESLELGEDDILATVEDQSRASGIANRVSSGGADEFLLTPLTESIDEDSESGSQVIALDTEASDDGMATVAGGTATASMVAMLEAGAAADAGAPGMFGAGMMAAQPMMYAPAEPSDAGLPETPYSIWNILSLALCIGLLTLTGMMMYDLVRNMWGWEGGNTVPSSLMEWIIKNVEGK